MTVIGSSNATQRRLRVVRLERFVGFGQPRRQPIEPGEERSVVNVRPVELVTERLFALGGDDDSPKEFWVVFDTLVHRLARVCKKPAREERGLIGDTVIDRLWLEEHRVRFGILFDELFVRFVEANDWPDWIVWFVIEGKDIFHSPDELSVLSRRNHPLFGPVWLEFIFLASAARFRERLTRHRPLRA